jgi:ABC-type amino acid transport system permease subunit
LLRVADVARASSFRIEETLFSAAIIYIYAFLSFVLTRAFYFAERQLDKDRLPPKPVTPAAAVPAK